MILATWDCTKKPRITRAMINRMEERRIAKVASVNEYRRLYKLIIETDRGMWGNNGPSEEMKEKLTKP